MRVRKVFVACVWGWMTNALARPGVGKEVLEGPVAGDGIVDIAEKPGVELESAGNCLGFGCTAAEVQVQVVFAAANGAGDCISSCSPSSSVGTSVFESATPCASFVPPPWFSHLLSGVRDTMTTLKTALLTRLPVVLLSLLGSLSWNEAIVQAQPASCPDFTLFAMSPQGSPSSGPLGLPLMRPAPQCRTFNSSAVENVIADMKARLKDPDLARLFENTFPNTLDTTVKYFDPSKNLAFIITGDITAQWLRDTANQFAHYKSLLTMDKGLARLMRAVINNEARYISQYPYCGAFQPPPESGLAPTVNDWALGVTVNPPVNNQTVFECKYEIDSLCGFLKLSTTYYQETKDASIINSNWMTAISQIFRVINEQSQASFDENFNWISYYNWTGGNGALSPAVNNAGNGEPKGFSGMVGTHHRPSDDLSTFAFLTPANAMLAVELVNLADMLDSAGGSRYANITGPARSLSSRIRDAVLSHGVVNGIFAYETNGLGSSYMMDDANVPSLLSLPYLGFLNRTDKTYIATRNVLLSRQNPYYAKGEFFQGIGGPHVDAWHPWPMSMISSIFGTDDDDEIIDALYTIANHTANLGLIHESQSINNPSDWTRPWFAWANSYFAEMMLDLADRKPGLIMKGGERYVPGMAGSFSEVGAGGAVEEEEEVEGGGEGGGEEGEGRKVLIKPVGSG